MTDSDSEKSEKRKLVTFESLGVCKELCKACKEMGWTSPTAIQEETIPIALGNRDVIALASTGSGKTGAFALPILQDLLENPLVFRALILAPTRELSVQIHDQFAALGKSIHVKVATLIGGLDIVTQALALAKRPHVIVGTPGRVKDHLKNTKGFSLKNIKFFVLDEADRLLAQEFDEGLESILASLPNTRQTSLFSATMTSDLSKLQKAALLNPVKVSIDTKRTTAQNLTEHWALVPEAHKHCYLLAALDHFGVASVIIFCNMCDTVSEVAVYLRHLGFKAISLTGKMNQPERLGALASFRASEKKILVATDVGSRGLDIPAVDVVINFDVPLKKTDYVHRVGRTARAGKSGRSLTIVNQYDVLNFQKIEKFLKKEIPQLEEITKVDYISRQESAVAALRSAQQEIRLSLKKRAPTQKYSVQSSGGTKRKNFNRK